MATKDEETVQNTNYGKALSLQDYVNMEYEDALAKAETQKQTAYQNAAMQKQQSMMGASSSYLQGKTNYGLYAEQANGMGLSMSGANDYASQSNYAAYRNNVAQAYAIEANAKQVADTNYNTAQDNAQSTYYQKMQTIAQNQADQAQADKNTWLEMLADGSLAAMSESDRKVLAQRYGIDDASYNDSESKIFTDNNTAYVNAVYNQITSTIEQGSNISNVFNTTESYIEQARESGVDQRYIDSMYNELTDKFVENAMYDTDAKSYLKKLYNDGKISKEKYDQSMTALKGNTFKVAKSSRVSTNVQLGTALDVRKGAITIDGDEYSLYGSFASSSERKVLDKEVGIKKIGQTVLYNGSLYYVAEGYHWVKVKSKKTATAYELACK